MKTDLPFTTLAPMMLLIASLAACSTTATPPTVRPATAASAPVATGPIEDLLLYHRAMNNLPAVDLNRELAALNNAPAGAATEVRKAIVLGAMRDNARLTRARAILGNALTADDAEAKALRPLIEWMLANTGELRRLTAVNERQAQQFKDAQKDAQRRYDQLNDKLEAMKRVESTQPASPVEVAPAPQ